MPYTDRTFHMCWSKSYSLVGFLGGEKYINPVLSTSFAYPEFCSSVMLLSVITGDVPFPEKNILTV